MLDQVLREANLVVAIKMGVPRRWAVLFFESQGRLRDNEKAEESLQSDL